MKITIEKHADGFTVDIDRPPIPEDRFKALYRLALTAIAGGVLLGAVRMVGVWAIVWAVGALVAVGLYKSIQRF